MNKIIIEQYFIAHFLYLIQTTQTIGCCTGGRSAYMTGVDYEGGYHE